MADDMIRGFANAGTPVQQVQLGGGWVRFEVTGQDSVPYAHAQIVPEQSPSVVIVQQVAAAASESASPPPSSASAASAPAPSSSASAAPSSATKANVNPCAPIEPQRGSPFDACAMLLRALLAEWGPCVLREIERELARTRGDQTELARTFDHVRARAEKA